MAVNLAVTENIHGSKYESRLFKQIDKLFMLVLSSLFPVIISYINVKTNINLSLSSFYIIPIVLVSWKFNKNIALFFTFAAISLEFGFQYYAKSLNPNYIQGFWTVGIDSLIYLFISLFICELKKKFIKEKLFSRKDFLTGLANRCYFMEAASRELEKSKRYSRPISVVFVDCDNFKYVNDTYGHDIGDKLLATVAKTIKKNIRLTDIAARFGGDEFVILLPETGVEQSKTAVKKIQDNLLKAMKADKLPVTFSTGIATFIKPPLSVADMLNKADRLMYEVKQNNKNGINQRVFYGKTTNTLNQQARFL